MLNDIQKTYLADLAEQLAQSWSKLGATIGYCLADSADPFKSMGFELSSWARNTVIRSFSSGTPVTFSDSEPERGFAIPVYCNGRCLGSIVCLLPGNLAEQTQGLFEIFLKHLERVQATYQNENELVALSQELSGSYEELSLIYKLGQNLHITEDPETFLSRFSDDLLEIIKAQELILLTDRRLIGGESCYQVGQMFVEGDSAKAAARYVYELTKFEAGPVILSECSGHPTLVQILRRPNMSVLACPIHVNNNYLGVLVVLSENSEEFDSTDAKLLGSIAEHTASFLQNRLLLKDIQDLLAGLLTSLVNAIDAKDPYTRGHSQRVAYIGQKIAQSLGLSQCECARVYMAGLLHDIGKIGVNDQVLSKPGKLTDEEYKTVQEHPVIGAKIISSVRQLRSILPGILNHHERYDGKGYSEGLAGEQIPTMGMIVGLADTFDAITSERTYRTVMSFKDAIKEVCDCSGTQFSPTVVNGLLDCDLEALEKDLKTLTNSGSEAQMFPNLTWLERWQ